MNMHVFRQADFIEGSIRNLKTALIEGGIIVTVVLIVFLMNFRASFISFVSMPASLLAGVMVLKWFGVSLNSMTIGGLAIAIGEVVDDAIIGVENVFRRLRLNRESPNPEPALDVVFKATSEIRNSVVYATYIVGIVFLPIFFLLGSGRPHLRAAGHRLSRLVAVFAPDRRHGDAGSLLYSPRQHQEGTEGKFCRALPSKSTTNGCCIRLAARLAGGHRGVGAGRHRRSR